MNSGSSPTNTVGIAAITKKGASLGRRLQELLPDSDLYLPERFADGDLSNQYTFVPPAKETIRAMFTRYRQLVLIMAVGAAVRILAPELKSKHEDPGVVVVDEAGTFAISLLSGHGGEANELAQKVAKVICARPVVTTATDVSDTLAVDLLGKEFDWKLDSNKNIKNVAASIINGEHIGIYQDAGEKHWWQKEKPLPSNIRIYSSIEDLIKSGSRSAIIISDRILNEESRLPADHTIIYRPMSLVVGIGCNRGTSASDIEDALLRLFSRNNISIDSIRNLATIDIKKDESGILEFAGKYNLPIQYFDKEPLSMVNSPSPPSPTVLQYTGTPTVSEAAAILSSGNNDLIIPKSSHGRMISLAVAKLKFDSYEPHLKGKLFLVGLGPGDPEHMTFRAREAIEQSEVVIGYSTYTKLIKPYIFQKEIISTGMGEEVQRVKTALGLAGRGKVVALLSSGDTGIYGMAGLVGEVLQGQHENGVPIEVIPGVPLLAASAALLGSPISGDFASISLSDYLVPWDKIALRLRLAAQGDFVIVIYNPKSKKRQSQLAEAREIVMQYRRSSTPVGIVTNAYREKQKLVITDLEHMLEHNIDMTTTIIIGNSNTFKLDGRIITPRGYETKYNLNEDRTTQ